MNPIETIQSIQDTCKVTRAEAITIITGALKTDEEVKSFFIELTKANKDWHISY